MLQHFNPSTTLVSTQIEKEVGTALALWAGEIFCHDTSHEKGELLVYTPTSGFLPHVALRVGEIKRKGASTINTAQ
jgi:hypothetical protein